MKSKIIFILSFVLYCLPSTGAPEYLKLERISSSPLGVAVLSANILLEPENSEYEVVVEGTLESSHLRLVQVSPRRALSITSALAEGEYEWEVKAYLQNKRLALQYQALILTLTNENNRLKWEILRETDSGERLLLEAQRDSNQILIEQTIELIAEHRQLVETKTLSFEIEYDRFSFQAKSNPALELSGDTNCLVGYPAEIGVHVLTSFQTNDGPAELRVKITDEVVSPVIPLQITASRRIGPKHFVMRSEPADVDHVGDHTLKVWLLARSSRESNIIREAINSAKAQKKAYVAQRALSIDPVERAFFASLMTEIDSITSALSTQLDALLTPVGEPEELYFPVNDLPSTLKAIGGV